MGIVSGVVTYLLIWWVVFFMVLPLGVRGQWEDADMVAGTEPGAPVSAHLGKKALLATAVAAALWLAVFLLITFGPFSLEDLKAPWGPNA